MSTEKLRKQESERQIRIHKNRCGNLFDETVVLMSRVKDETV